MKLLDFLLEQDALGIHPEKIEQEAWNKFGRKVAVLNIDSVGFSRTTKSHGIVHFLTRMAKARDCMSSVLGAMDTISFGYHADNCIAYFDTPQKAVDAVLALQSAVLKSGITLNDSEHYGLCAGIGYGELLYSQTLDGYFGDEMNLASRLGEDTAKRDEILLTQNARNALTDGADLRFEARSLEASGALVNYYALKR